MDIQGSGANSEGGGKAIQAQRAKAPEERLTLGAAEFVDGNF